MSESFRDSFRPVRPVSYLTGIDHFAPFPVWEDDGDSCCDRMNSNNGNSVNFVDDEGTNMIIANTFADAFDAETGGTVDQAVIICEFCLKSRFLKIVYRDVFLSCVATFDSDGHCRLF